MLQAEIVASYYTISTLFDATTDGFSICRNSQNGIFQDIHARHSAAGKTFGADRSRSELYGMSRTVLFPAETYEHIKLFTIITANLQCLNTTEMVGYGSKRNGIVPDRAETQKTAESRRKRRKDIMPFCPARLYSG